MTSTIYTIHIPIEWIDVDEPIADTIRNILYVSDLYADQYGTYEGCGISINEIYAALFIDNRRSKILV